MEIQTEDCSWCCKSASVLAWRVSSGLHRPSGHATQQHSPHSWLHTHGGWLWPRPAANEWRDGGRNTGSWYFGVSHNACTFVAYLGIPMRDGALEVENKQSPIVLVVDSCILVIHDREEAPLVGELQGAGRAFSIVSREFDFPSSSISVTLRFLRMEGGWLWS